jgi:4-amino-4-deoxy-L-arabinose transferase-like glycosyltransferase
VLRLLAVATTIYGPMIGMHALCITGAGGWAIPGAESFFFVPLVCMLIGLGALPCLLRRRWRSRAASTLFYAVGLVVLFMPAMSVAVGARRYGFTLAAERARPLVSALTRFEREKGRPPLALNELTPAYLPRLPSGIPPVELVARENTPEAYGGNRWVLIAYVPSAVMSFDAFVYFPNQNYEAMSGVTRIADWAYLHD